MVKELVEASIAPTQGLDVAVEVDVVGLLTMAVVANPALVGIFAGAPVHERSFPDPSVVVVLRDAAIFGVIRRARVHGNGRLGGCGREWTTSGANQCCGRGWQTALATGSAPEAGWRRHGGGPRRVA